MLSNFVRATGFLTAVLVTLSALQAEDGSYSISDDTSSTREATPIEAELASFAGRAQLRRRMQERLRLLWLRRRIARAVPRSQRYVLQQLHQPDDEPGLL